MQTLIESMPGWLLCILFVSITCMVSLSGLWIVRKMVPHDKLRESHDVAGFIIGIIGVMYAVVLAFVVIAVWEDYRQTDDTVMNETNAIGNLYRDCTGLEDSAAEDIKFDLRQYTEQVIDSEWQEMEAGRESSKAWASFNALYIHVIHIDPKTDREQALFSALLDNLTKFSDIRRARITESKPYIPGLIWLILIAGSLIIIFFTYFFAVDNIRIQQLMTVMLSTTMALVLFMGVLFNYPFNGDFAIKPDGFERLLKYSFPAADKADTFHKRKFEAWVPKKKEKKEKKKK